MNLAFELQKRLVQTCIDFINENMLVHEDVKKIYQVEFSADCLQESAKHGEWQPCTDSYCALTGTKPITIGKYADTGDDVVINEGYLIDKSY